MMLFVLNKIRRNKSKNVKNNVEKVTSANKMINSMLELLGYTSFVLFLNTIYSMQPNISWPYKNEYTILTK